MLLVDSHCHLDFPEYTGNLGAVVQRAGDNGVHYMQTISTRMSTCEKVINVAEQFPQVYASIGVHPNHVHEEPEVTVAQLHQYAGHEKVIGIGETGLDYYRDIAHRDAQQRSFRTHITVARETGLPVIVHTRDAEEDTIQLLSDEMKKGAFRGLIHCFTAGKKLAGAMLDIGFYISVSGVLTFKNARELQDVVRGIPLERLLLETDAPFLAPIPYRGKTNEPAFTKYTALFLAELKGLTFEEVAKTTTHNFFTLFSKAKRDIMHKN